MKAAVFNCIALLVLGVGALADDFKLSDGREFKNVIVKRVESDGLVVVTDSGIEKIPFDLLPVEIQQKYNYDPKTPAVTAPTPSPVAQSSNPEGPQNKTEVTGEESEQTKLVYVDSDEAALKLAKDYMAQGATYVEIEHALLSDNPHRWRVQAMFHTKS